MYSPQVAGPVLGQLEQFIRGRLLHLFNTDSTVDSANGTCQFVASIGPTLLSLVGI